ncbi:Asp-tRNA(Asn)/Glu-tRNA(Gln) amidotransferase subunit GatC [Kallotenue papyrolyticum]|uniref:Asp-tRNA(Asn)/Glu-tRNA(Gln) amidotransferase subunit GatC n=1 Tax=Kallotenue papyrolyticum TaxID=1325125 RepID=UPI0004928F4B|nr:Asp-tRNA(Asn)/Glu-tRNA(Gln) amidotransferase subunit GatC [Kallotenue papyrolyticum]
MALTLEEVRHVAHLARLRLSAEELARMRQQLSSILDYMQMLQEVEVGGVPPTAQVTDVVNVLRPDEVRPSLPVDEALAGAPAREDGYFKVKAVFEE